MTKIELLNAYTGALNAPHESLENLTPIQFAAKHGEYAYLDKVLSSLDGEQKRLALETGNAGGGLTALHFATRYGECATIKVLLTHGASTQAETTLRQTPLQTAFNRKNSKQTIIEIFHLLGQDNTALGHVNFNGDSVAHLAAELDIVEIVEIIQLNAPRLLSRKNSQSMTPLLVAVRNNAINSIRILCTTPEAQQRDSVQRNALHYAAIYADEACVELLIPYFDLNACDDERNTALDLAKNAENVNPDKVACLTRASELQQSTSSPEAS